MLNFDVDAIRQIPVIDIISRETDVNFVTTAYSAENQFTRCPMHNDKGPSLSVSKSKNLWYCHGSCGVGGDGIKFIMLKRGIDFQEACKHISELFNIPLIEDGKKQKPKKATSGKGVKPMPVIPIPENALTEGLPNTLKGDWWLKHYGEFVTAWRYHDPKGGVAYVDARFKQQIVDKEGNAKEGQFKKNVVPLYWGRTGRWKMGIPYEVLKTPRILFNLHLLVASPDKPVIVVEGCKCASVEAQALRDHVIFTTWPQGTNGIPKVDIRPLYNRKVYIWPDGDRPDDKHIRGGYKAAYYLAAKLDGKSDVTILRTAEHPKGKKTKHGYDIEDYIDDGGDPVKYVFDPDNVISLDDTKALAGLKALETDEIPHFNDVRIFTTLSEPSNDTILKLNEAFERNDKHNVMKNDGNFLKITELDPDFWHLFATDTATGNLLFSDKYTEADEIDNAIWKYCQRFYGIPPSGKQRTDMIKSIAYRNSFNSLEIFLDDLKTEEFAEHEPSFKTNPLDDILEHMNFSTEENEDYQDNNLIRQYYTELFHIFFLRMFIKLEYIIRGDIDNVPPADVVPILEGEQGIGKTRFCWFLSLEPQKYYVDMSELLLTTSRDTLAKIKGKLIGELGELAGLKRTELESIKAFISAPFDEMRKLYQEFTIKSPRTVSFIGSTNEREYLRDTTGNRRFYPVRIDSVDFDLYGKKELIKLLYIYYRELAKKSITGNTVEMDMLPSKELNDFMLYQREEKRVQPVFIDLIVNYIEDIETIASNMFNQEPVKINIRMAADAIYETPPGKITAMPPRFESEFKRLLIERGYKNKRGKLEGNNCRYWQLDGAYCGMCRRVVEGVTSIELKTGSTRVCDDCIEKNKKKIMETEPF